MMVMGMIGVLQAASLPGPSAVSLFSVKKKEDVNVPEFFLFSFGISLVFNYSMTLFLTLIHMNTLFPQVGFLFLEAALISWSFSRNRQFFWTKVLPAFFFFLSSAVIILLLY